MSTTRSFLYFTLAALYMAAPAAHAEETPIQPEGGAVASDTETDSAYAAMQERYRLMHEQMLKIRQTPDPVERQRLLQEHWQTFHGGIGAGRGMRHGITMGAGPGMGGARGMGLQAPELSEAQRSQIAGIQAETRKQNWQLMGQIMEEQIKLGELYNAAQPDQAAIKQAYGNVMALQQQVRETVLDAHKRMEALLTPEQQAQLEQIRQYWRRGGYPGY